MKTCNIIVTVHISQADKALRIIHAMNLTAVNRDGTLTIHNFASLGTVRDLLTSNSIPIAYGPRLP